MNEKSPPVFEIIGDKPVEARICAWVLGEASAFEIAELERLCDERPELRIYRRRMTALQGLLIEATAPEKDLTWKLPPEKRQALDEIFGQKNATPVDASQALPARRGEQGIRRSGRKALLAIAACLVLSFVIARLVGPMGRMSPAKSAANSEIAPSSPAVPAAGTYRLDSKLASLNREPGMLESKEQNTLAKSPPQPASQVAAAATAFQSELPTPVDSSVIAPLPAVAANGLNGGEMNAPAAPFATAQDEAYLYADHGGPKRKLHLSKSAEPKKLAGATREINPAAFDVGPGRRMVETTMSGSDSDVPPSAHASFQSSTHQEKQPGGDAMMLAALANETSAAGSRTSTFPLNPGDVSFQLAKASLAKGELPEPSSIQHEHFYNAVDYGDPAPASHEPVSAAIEQSLHPVIPGRSLVRVAIRTGSAGRSVSRPLHLTLLVDQSGSMLREDRRALMESVLSQLGALLTKKDRVTIIGFSSSPRLIVDGQAAGGSLNLAGLIQQTTAEDGTNLQQALKLGEQHAERLQRAGAQSRIVLFTAGTADFGEATKVRLAEQVKSLRQRGFALDIACIHTEGRNDRWLSELARSGNGRFDAVRDGKNDRFACQLAGPFRPAAEEVEVRVNFNPKRVGSYQLIGFEEKKQSAAAAHRSGDGEISAGQAGVAIYQVGLLRDGVGDIGEVSVRFRDPASKETEERNWAIPHESRAVAFDQATPSMQLAGLSLLAAEKLKGGPLAGAIHFANLTGPSAVVKQFYSDSPRVGDMLRIVEKLR